MSEENVEIVRRIYEQWSEGDFRGGSDLLDPQVVVVIPGGFPDPGTYLGTEAIAAYTRTVMLETWERLTIEAEELLGAEDSVLADVHQRGVGSTSGVPAEMRYFTLWSFRGSKVIRIESFRERAEALEAAGLSE
ncbi:MAG: nuclear transport factor 2 family protein [Actinobacteria bacterium]|nr:nuclear transport factor 2 family protein [Actinomycetota bacterium]